MEEQYLFDIYHNKTTLYNLLTFQTKNSNLPFSARLSSTDLENYPGKMKIIGLFFAFVSFTAALLAYDSALQAIQECNTQRLEEILSVEDHECVDEILTGRARESLIFNVAIKGQCLPAIQVLAAFGVESAGSKVFQNCMRQVFPCEHAFYGQLFDFSAQYQVSVSTAQSLLDLGFIKPEDLWGIAIKSGNDALWKWIRNHGADINYKISTKEHAYIPAQRRGYISVIAYCVRMKRLNFIEELLNEGVDVNEHCGWFALNLLAVCVNTGFDDWRLLKRIIRETDDPLIFLTVIIRDQSPSFLEALDALLSDEIVERSFDQNWMKQMRRFYSGVSVPKYKDFDLNLIFPETLAAARKNFNLQAL